MRSSGPENRHERTALAAGIAAFAFWGVIPVYWKLLASVPAAEILAHRLVWTTSFLICLLAWQRRWPEVVGNVRSRRAISYCIGSGIAVSLNWLTFIWAVNIGRVLETSLGYFMTPLVNVLFGAVFLRERLTRWQFASVLLAAAAVLNRTFGYGRFPWIAIVLCVTWGVYGLLRKLSGTAAIPGLFLETIILTPVAIGYLLLVHSRGAGVAGLNDGTITLLLISTGIVTGLPLVSFGHAARHLRLTTIGFLQYLAPSGTFFLGVFLYREPFTTAHLITFGLIWLALAIFTWEMVRLWRAARPVPGAAPPIAE